jgi:hypothetical protein
MVSRLIICVLSIFISVLPLHAEGTYYVGRDEGGVFFQTDVHGGWYIDQVDLKTFTKGETGTYQIGSDRYGTYIVTDKLRKFYIDTDASKKLDRQIEQFNRQQEKLAENYETPVIIRGNQVLVPVTLRYGSKKNGGFASYGYGCLNHNFVSGNL